MLRTVSASCGCGTIFDTTPHTFDQKVESEDALKSEATCNKDAEYYYSCVCGAISETETFTKTGYLCVTTAEVPMVDGQEAAYAQTQYARRS